MNSVDTYRIVLVDDHAIVREGLQTMLDAEDDLEVVGQAGSIAQAILRVKQLQPDLVLLDVQLPDGNGVDACAEIKLIAPDTKVLMLTSFADQGLLDKAIAAGAAGYLLKRVKPADLLGGIRKAASGEMLLDDSVVGGVVQRLQHGDEDSQVADLSPQEQKVLMLLAEGMTNREIGEQLYLAEKTVKNYVSNMLAKLDMSNRSEAAVFAAKLAADADTQLPAASWEELRARHT
jgi:two-component system, NarL family, response regulator DevR